MIINDRVYGPFEITDPCVLELIASPAFDRLWHVNQNGAQSLIEATWSTSRAEHCLGVYRLLGLFGASREEQIAGLLHDANHLAFSHVIDYLFNDTEHQESHHAVFPENPHLTELARIVTQHGLDAKAVMDYDHYTLLEQPSGKLCADRIDYTFRDSLNAEQSTLEEIRHAFIPGIKNIDGRFIMIDADVAERFARVSIDTDTIRVSHVGVGLFASLAGLLRYAMNTGVIHQDELLTHDEILLSKLRASQDPTIQSFFMWISAGAPIELGTPEHYHVAAFEKFRWINADVIVDGKVAPVSSLKPGLNRLVNATNYSKRTPRYVRISEPHAENMRALWK